ncbi:MAG: preprotein translocase subunit SecE [Candidatus Coatesbacteria bacterium]
MGVREWFERAKAFVAEVGQEVRRVTWPTSREIAGATAVVIAATAALALLLAFYDLLISNVLLVILR